MRYVHNGVQVLALLLIAWSVYRLCGIGWAGLTLGVIMLAWSVLAELAAPRRKRASVTNLRDVA